MKVSLLAGIVAAMSGLLVLGNIGPRRAATAEETPAVKPFGIEQRIPWTTSRVVGSPEPPTPYQLERAFPKLNFKFPLDFTVAPGSDRIYVVEIGGVIYSFPNDPACDKPEVFIDLPKEIPGTTGAYGIAFHPKFAENRYVFLFTIMKQQTPNGTRISRFEVSRTDPPVCDPKSEKVFLEWFSGGHNGGCIKFGPDGFLYLTTGDADDPSPPDRRDTGQDLSDLLSSVLRIDVDHPGTETPYSIPPDNPFIALKDARPEIWAYGFRNPWRMSFDKATGDLWVGDVGWDMWELVFKVERGGNYGWSIMEGRQHVRPEAKRGPTPIIPPVVEHPHSEAASITGGIVYRGKQLPELVGTYIYGDYVTGKIWGLRYDGQKVTSLRELVNTNLKIVSFGEDQAGELYIVTQEGPLQRLVPNPASGSASEFPQTLSQTGLFTSVTNHVLAPGVIPYSINAVPWADGASSERALALPGETMVPSGADGKGFPKDSVLVKTLSLPLAGSSTGNQQRIETQILHRGGEFWRGYSYVWNAEQTDATLVAAEGLDRSYQVADPAAPGGQRTQSWHFSSRTECGRCHNQYAGFVLGFNIPQLNRDHAYGAFTDNQLRTLAHISAYGTQVEGKVQPGRIDPNDPAADLNQRARTYLHANCFHCHREGGGGTTTIELGYDFDLKKMKAVGVRPSQGTFDILSAQIIAPGDPFRSALYYRISKLGRGRMPHIGSGVVDQAGTDLIYRWIAQLPKDAGAAQPIDEAAAGLRAEEAAALAVIRETPVAAAEWSSALERLLTSASGSMLLLRAIEEKVLNEAIRAEVIARATVTADPLARDLFERFIPEENRLKRLGSVIRPEQILALAGEAERGKQTFLKGAGSQCRNCHVIQGTGREVGPELSQIGKKYNRAQLLENLLEPSKAIEPKYVVYLVETKAGQVHTGLLINRTPDEVILKNSEGKELKFPASEIELLVPQRTSLMPELLLRDMTPQEVADLLEFLQGLR